MKKIVIVTKPCNRHGKPVNKDNVQFAYDHLEHQGMKPFWYRSRTGLAVARPALIDDPAEIVEKEE